MLPDPVARVALVPAIEVVGRRRSEVDELLRFRLRKSLPFDVREARLALRALRTRAADPDRRGRAGPVLEGYEEACRVAGAGAGAGRAGGLALCRAAFAPGPTGDRLLVNWDEGYVDAAPRRATDGPCWSAR